MTIFWTALVCSAVYGAAALVGFRFLRQRCEDMLRRQDEAVAPLRNPAHVWTSVHGPRVAEAHGYDRTTGAYVRRPEDLTGWGPHTVLHVVGDIRPDIASRVPGGWTVVWHDPDPGVTTCPEGCPRRSDSRPVGEG